MNFLDALEPALARLGDTRRLVIGRSPDAPRSPASVARLALDPIRMRRAAAQSDWIIVNSAFRWRTLARDVVHLLAILPARRGRVCLFLHGWDREFFESIARRFWARRLFKGVLGRVDRILVLSRRYRAMLARLGIDPDRVTVTTTTFDPDLIRTRAPSREQDRPVHFLFLSRLVPGKGLPTVLEASALLRERQVAHRLTIAGVGPLEADARRRVRELGLSDTVRFAGFVSGREKRLLLDDSDVFLLPTALDEGLPVSILEAMGAGLAILVSPVGGIPEVIQEDRDGVEFVPPENPRRLAHAMIRLTKDPARRVRMAGAARRRARDHFIPSVVARRLARTLD